MEIFLYLNHEDENKYIRFIFTVQRDIHDYFGGVKKKSTHQRVYTLGCNGRRKNPIPGNLLYIILYDKGLKKFKITDIKHI